MHLRRTHVVLSLLLAVAAASAGDGGDFRLRGYGELRWGAPPAAAAAAHLHRFTLSTPELAARFASKLFADFAQTPGNQVRPAGSGDGDLIELAGVGVVVPLAVALRAYVEAGGILAHPAADLAGQVRELRILPGMVEPVPVP